MESSALVYIFLTLIVVGIGLFVQNEGYVEEHISGVRPYGYCPGRNREQARNLIAVTGIYLLLMGVSACRVAVGNDYWVYRDNFKMIAQSREVSYEFGFNYIVKWIQLLFGYDEYKPVFAFFSIVTVYFFVRAMYDQGKHFAFTLFLLMTGGFYFNSLNSVRYYLALAIAMFTMKYVLRGEYAKFVLWVLVGSMFHKSVLLVIPVYLAARFLASARLKRWHYIVGILIAGSLVFGQNIYREIIFYFYPFYRGSMFDDGQLSYTNILKCVCVLILCAICYKKSLKRDIANRFYLFLNIFGFVIYCCGSFIPEVSRIGYYMIVSQVFLLPKLLSEMEDGWFKKVCYVGVISAFTAYFIVLLHGMYDKNIRLLPYLNWIFN